MTQQKLRPSVQQSHYIFFSISECTEIGCEVMAAFQIINQLTGNIYNHKYIYLDKLTNDVIWLT